MKKGFKSQDILVVLLFLEALLVLIGLLLGQSVQVGIICYWFILACKNLLDWMDRRHGNDGK